MTIDALDFRVVLTSLAGTCGRCGDYAFRRFAPGVTGSLCHECWDTLREAAGADTQPG